MSLQDIGEQFTRILGREPRKDEIDFFDKFIKENNLQPYEIGQILQSSPEYQNKLAETQQGKQLSEFQNLLGFGDQQILGQAQDMLTGQFARQGRAGSSGYVSAFANAARDLALNRQNSLANFYGATVPGINNQLRGISLEQGQAGLARGFGLAAEKRQRGYDLEDFYRNIRLAQEGANARLRSSRAGAFGRGIGGLVGTGIGAYAGSFGGPGGSLIGAQLGSQLGSETGSLFPVY